MAEPVFIVRNSQGQVTIDSRDAAAGACVDLLEILPSTAPVYTYPDFVGRTVIALSLSIAVAPTIDTSLGYPRLTFTSSPSYRYFTVIVL